MKRSPVAASGAGHRPAARGNAGPLLWVVLAAFALKFAILAQLGEHPLLQPHGDLDTSRFVELARQMAAAGPLAVHEPLFLSPLYVYFLAGVFSTGGSLFAARLVQILLGSAAAAFVYLLGRDWFGERVGVVAAVLALLTGFLTFSEILILQSSLDPVLTAASLYFVSRTQATTRRWPLVAAGVTLGLFALNRPNALPYGLAAAALVGLASMRRGENDAPGTGGSPLLRAALVLLPLLGVLGVNALRNQLASGEAILISSHGGLNFYIGNNATADGTYTPVPGISASIAGQVQDSTRVAESAEGRVLSRGEVSRYFYRRAWEWIASQPGRAAALFARKLAILLNRTDVPLNYSYRFYSRDESTLLRLLAVGPMFLIPLGLVGLFLGARPHVTALERAASGIPASASYWTWASFVPVYGISVAAFFVSDRYRMPLLVPLAVLTALTLVWLTERIRQRQFAAMTVPAAGVVLAAVITAWDLGLDDGLGGERARKAAYLIEQGSSEEARRYVDRAANGLRHPGVFHFRVGEALIAADRYEDAIVHLRTALDIDRGQPAIQLALGQALLLGGHSQASVAPLSAALAAAFRPEVSGPWLVRALAEAGSRDEAVRTLANLSDDVVAGAGAATQLEIGSLALELRAPAAAERWLRAAAVHAPESAAALEKLGVSRLLQARPGDALAPIERACRLAPSSASARLNLAVAYAQLGRFADARTAAREAVRLDSSEPRAAALLEKLSREPR